jgi:2-keto-4-pentenoate hydratase/2-oxohepta-3-ene-1,7-dioic acid hydratase in catechol pathway
VKLPEHPIYFTKAATSINHPDEPIVFSRRWTEQVDWEVELAVVIGVGGRDIPKERVFDHIAGYMVGNDVSAREVQRNHQQFYRGKSLDTFCPLGPWLVTRDEIPDPHNLRLTLRVNGVTKQDSNTRYMIFDIPTTVSVLSLGQTLEPGDVILTGTPDGVGFARTPPEFLKHGDVVEAEIEGIGVLRNPVVEIP